MANIVMVSLIAIVHVINYLSSYICYNTCVHGVLLLFVLLVACLLDLQLGWESAIKCFRLLSHKHNNNWDDPHT